MRGLLAIPVLVALGGSSAIAAGPSGSAQQTIAVSVEVVRSCTVDAQGGSATVTCGLQGLASQPSFQSNAPKPFVTEAGQSADSTATVQF
jgi:hypothetical protein